MKLTNQRDADVTIEASGDPRAISEGLHMTRDNGTYVVAGQYTDAGDIVINPHWQIIRKHVDIRGVWGIDYSHFYRAIQLMAKHRDRFGWHRLVSRVYGLGEVQTALEDFESLKIFKAVIAPNDL